MIGKNIGKEESNQGSDSGLFSEEGGKHGHYHATHARVGEVGTSFAELVWMVLSRIEDHTVQQNTGISHTHMSGPYGDLPLTVVQLPDRQVRTTKVIKEVS